MQTATRRFAKTSALAFLTLTLLGAAAEAQPATVDARDLLIRMQRMERDIRDLQATTFRRPPGAVADAPSGPAGGTQDLSPIMRRIDEFSDGITRLTGQMEELNHQIDMLQQKTDRLQKEMDFNARQAAEGQGPVPPGDAALPQPEGGNAVASLAPPPRPGEGVLGRIPRGADLPPPPPAPANPKAEYDAAMGLLSRAQYVPAGEAFKAFVDAHPDDERAPLALYYAGDIAYSTKKDYQEAARSFAELLKRYPMSARAPEGMLKLGMALLDLDQMKEGCAALAALPAKYPNASPAIATRARNERRDNKCR